MAWIIEFDRDVEKDFRKLGSTAQKRIINYLKKTIANCDNPRSLGKSLTGNLNGFWRYRVGYYRIISTIEDRIFTVVVIKIDHRKDIYS